MSVHSVPTKYRPMQAAAETYLRMMAADLDIDDLVIVVFESVPGACASIGVATHRGAVAMLDGCDSIGLAAEIEGAREAGCATVALCAADGTGLAFAMRLDGARVNAPGGEA